MTITFYVLNESSSIQIDSIEPLDQPLYALVNLARDYAKNLKPTADYFTIGNVPYAVRPAQRRYIETLYKQGVICTQ